MVRNDYYPAPVLLYPKVKDPFVEAALHRVSIQLSPNLKTCTKRLNMVHVVNEQAHYFSSFDYRTGPSTSSSRKVQKYSEAKA